MLSHSQTVLPNKPISTATDIEATIDHLRQIGESHELCYEVRPEWSIAEGQKISIGFELDLCGLNDHVTDRNSHPVPGCSQCARTYQELRQIAEWILPVEERPSRHEIRPFDRALHIAPGQRHRRSEVVVTIVIVHRSDFNRSVDECENRCLTEMREKLSQLSVHQGMSHGLGSRK